MRKYETVVIFDPTLGEDKVNKEISKVEGIIKHAGAAQLSVNSWGRKQIAYKVGRHKNGVYVEFKYESDKSDIVEVLTNQLRITESVIKFQNHRLPDRVRKFQGRPGGRQGALGDWGSDDNVDDARY